MSPHTPSAPSSASNATTLTASYTSPSITQTLTHALPSPTTTTLAQKTAYLSHLRQSMTKLQDQVNVFLTAKMEEDKALVEKAGVNGKVDERKEEDFYGEEDLQDEG